MKDLIITKRRQKIELLVYLVCLLIAIGLNIYAINRFNNTSWSELLTQLPYVFIISLAFYVVFTLLRIVVRLFSIPFRKSKDYSDGKSENITL